MPPPDPQPDWVLDRRRAIGQRVRNARKDAELTQEKLAELVSVGWRTIHRIEYGTTDASLSTLLRIAHEVRVPLRDLIG